MPVCQSGAIWRVYLEIELEHRKRPNLCAARIKIAEESLAVMLEKIAQPLHFQGGGGQKKWKPVETD